MNFGVKLFCFRGISSGTLLVLFPTDLISLFTFPHLYSLLWPVYYIFLVTDFYIHLCIAIVFLGSEFSICPCCWFGYILFWNGFSWLISMLLSIYFHLNQMPPLRVFVSSFCLYERLLYFYFFSFWRCLCLSFQFLVLSHLGNAFCFIASSLIYAWISIMVG